MDSYREPEKYYEPKEFFRATEGISDTAVFRHAVSAKIREQRKAGPEKMDNLQLFVKVNTLWQSVQEIRDLHHEEWPLFVITEEKKDDCEFGKRLSTVVRRQVFI